MQKKLSLNENNVAGFFGVGLFYFDSWWRSLTLYI